jgi:PAS domain S-box-containing protein
LLNRIGNYVIFTTDVSGVIINWGKDAELLFGYKQKEIIGKSINGLYTPEAISQNEPAKNLHQAFVFANYRTEGWRVKKDGSLFWADVNYTALFDDDNELSGYAKITREVKNKNFSGKKVSVGGEMPHPEKLLGNDNRFRKLVENSCEGICLLDRNFNVIYRSNSTERIGGWETKERVKQATLDLVHEDDRENASRLLTEVLQNPGQPHTIIYRSKHFAGHYIWLESIFTNFLNEPDINAIVCNYRDITEKIIAEQVLVESEKKYKLLFEGSPLPKIIWDFDTLQIIDCNEATLINYGYNRDEFLTLKIGDLGPLEDVVFFDELMKPGLLENKIQKGVWRNKKKNGEAILLEITSSLITYNGNTAVISIGNDITESHYYHELEKLEKEILELNAWSNKSLNEAIGVYLKGIEVLHPGMICSVLEKKGNKLYSMASPSLPRSYQDAINGLAVADNSGSCGTAAFFKQMVVVSDIQHDVRWVNFKEIAAAHNLAACWSHPVMNTGGAVMATFASYYKIAKEPTEPEKNTIQRAVHILQVILESHSREQALKLSNERFEYVTEATSDVIWDWDLITNSVYYSRNMTKLFGHPSGVNPDNLPFYFENVHPDDRDRVLLYPDQVKNGTMVNWMQEYRFKKANGEYAFLCDRGIVIRDENGLGTRMVGAMQDITKQKQEEHHLRLLESVVTHAKDSILITEAEPFDEPGPRILYVNKAFTNMTGYLPEEVIGKTPRILQGPKTDKQELKRLSEALHKWETCEVTVLNYKKNGEEFWLNFCLVPVADEKGWYTHWISIERDVTQKKNEEMLRGLLTDISYIFNTRDNLQEAIAKSMVGLGDYGDFGITEFWQVAADKKNISRVASYLRSDKLEDFNAETAKYKSIVKGEGLIGTAWATQKIQNWSHRGTTLFIKRFEAAKKAGIKRAYSLPLVYNDEVIGVLVLMLDRDEPPNRGFYDLFESFSKVFAAEIRRKQVADELNQIFTFAPDVLCIINEAGYFIKINPAMCSLFEYTEEELLSRPFSGFVHPADVEKTTSGFRNIYEKKPSTYSENRYLTKSGKTKWMAWTNSLMRENGLVYCVGRDITEKKELESLLHNATALARIGGWEVDLKKDLVYWSDMTREIHETAPGFVPDIKTAINFYKKGKDRETIEEVIGRAVKYGEQRDLELQIITAKGNEKWVRVIVETEFLNGKCARLYGSFQDIDTVKRLEITGKQALEDQNKKLKEISWMQSHLVRAPLARILGLVPLLEDTTATIDEKMEMMDYLLTSANDLDEIIREITYKARTTDEQLPG